MFGAGDGRCNVTRRSACWGGSVAITGSIGFPFGMEPNARSMRCSISPALLVADSILSGAKPMGMGGGSAMGRSSRLYRSLVSTGLTRGASSGAGLHLDPFLWTFSATALPGVEPERIEAAFEEQLATLRDELASEDEFLKARKQIRAQYVYSTETVTAQAFWAGQMEIVDHAGRVDTLEEELAAVTPEDVRRVAQTWLVPTGRTIGWELPVQNGSASGGVDAPEPVADQVEAVAPFNLERPWYLSCLLYTSDAADDLTR